MVSRRVISVVVLPVDSSLATQSLQLNHILEGYFFCTALLQTNTHYCTFTKLSLIMASFFVVVLFTVDFGVSILQNVSLVRV